MAAHLYLGNLAHETTEDTLRKVLEQDGRTVKSLVIKADKSTGKSRGFAFAELGTPEEVESAIASLAGMELDGRPIKVNHGHERPLYGGRNRSDDPGDRGGFRRGGGGGGGGRGRR